MSAAVFGVFLCVLLVTPAIGQDGKEIYNNRCALCHGADGDGKGVIMQIAPFGADFWKANDDASISKSIVEGKGRMPAIPLSPGDEGRRGVHEGELQEVMPVASRGGMVEHPDPRGLHLQNVMLTPVMAVIPGMG